jgi:chemotaxis protein methyltransferase CheR
LSPADLEFLCALVRVRSGLVLTGERGFFAETRLSPLARREGAVSVSDLVQRVKTAGDDRLLRAVVEAMLIQETSFFRDRTVFRALQDQILPSLAAARGGRVRVWSAGCGSGQEAYSLAMMAEDAATLAEPDIFASDLSTAALEKAESGLYTHFEVQRGLPIRSLLRHFEPAGDAWRILPDIRQKVRWRRLNLVDQFTVGEPFDLILCRNVIDGFAPTAKAKAIEGLMQALAPDGWLVLGAHEVAPTGLAAAGAAGVYRRKLAAIEAA